MPGYISKKNKTFHFKSRALTLQKNVTFIFRYIIPIRLIKKDITSVRAISVQAYKINKKFKSIRVSEHAVKPSVHSTFTHIHYLSLLDC